MNSKIIQFIKESNLSDDDKESFLYLAERAEEGELNEFTDKIFLFEGSPGIGKTYFLKNFLEMLKIHVLYIGPFEFKAENVSRFKDLKKLLESLDKNKLTAVFIDDVNNSLNFIKTDCDTFLEDKERKIFLKLLETIKENSKTAIFMTLNDSFHGRVLD